MNTQTLALKARHDDNARVALIAVVDPVVRSWAHGDQDLAQEGRLEVLEALRGFQEDMDFEARYKTRLRWHKWHCWAKASNRPEILSCEDLDPRDTVEDHYGDVNLQVSLEQELPQDQLAVVQWMLDGNDRLRYAQLQGISYGRANRLAHKAGESLVSAGVLHV